MLEDSYGNRITTVRPETVEAFDEYTHGFLSYGRTLPRIIEAADADPDCCAAQAHAAVVHMAFEAASGFRKAEPYLARAQELAPQATAREQLFTEAATAWRRRDFPRTAEILTEHAGRWPEDLAAAKWGQYHAFNLGDHQTLLWQTENLVRAHPDAPFVHGMHAFALEQMNRPEEAEEAGRRAVAIERNDPWAHHAVAHVMETQGRVEEGLDWMLGLSSTWEDRGFFIRLHNWWHVALFHMDRDEYAAALDIFDRHLIDLYPEFCQEQIGAIAALWRLELRGIDVGARWEPLAARVRERELEHILPFHDLHYVHALARCTSHCEVDTFLMSMERHALSLGQPWGRTWRDVAVPTAHGIAAHAQGRYEDAVNFMGPCLDRLQEIGGSHAQRDIFVQTYLDALLKAGNRTAARPLLRARYEARPHVPVTARMLEAAD